MQVPVYSIICMAISAIISIGLPIGLFIFAYKRYNAKITPMLVGIIGFVLFVLGAERAIHTLVLGAFSLRSRPILYILYSVSMAGIFEETARFISFTMLKKKYDGIGTGLAYGLGHGGAESILLVGLSLVNTLILCISINRGNIEALLNSAQGDVWEQIQSQLMVLLMTPPYLFLMSGFERIVALCSQLSLSILVFYSVHAKNAVWLYPAAILAHAILDVPAAAVQVGLLKNIVLSELLVVLAALVLIVIARSIHTRLKRTGDLHTYG